MFVIGAMVMPHAYPMQAHARVCEENKLELEELEEKKQHLLKQLCR